jgi:hypothetical protein
MDENVMMTYLSYFRNAQRTRTSARTSGTTSSMGPLVASMRGMDRPSVWPRPEEHAHARVVCGA